MAASHTVFYLVSAALFLPLVAGMFLFMQDTADAPQDPARGLQSRASSALAQITSNPGKAGGLQHSYWQNLGNGLSVDEVGIRDENSSLLSYDKIDNLQRGGLSANGADPFLNYPEFKDALRLGDDLDFHIRLSPVILNPGNDPFGAKPLAGMHVAYVASLQSETVLADAFTDPTTVAANEIAALTALGLQTDATDNDNGFDGTWYQPGNNLVTGPVPPGPVNAVDGDVIADTSLSYQPEALGTTKTYDQWFWDNHFKTASGTYRYDALIFGGDVDLTRWDDNKDELKAFVNQGGVVIFMGDSGNAQNGFILNCNGDTDCLLHDTGTQEAPTTPDTTNQMLYVPNRISTSTFPKHANTFDVCDHSASPPGVDELDGWIPVDIVQPVVGSCLNTHFGATSADRYGSTGGTVILTRWDMASVAEPEVSKAFSNLLSYGLLRPVYLDYGPEIPIDSPVVTAERLMLTQFPTGEYMDVKIVFYLWRA